MKNSIRIVRVVALAVLASMTIAGIALAALAAKPENGKTYSGTINRYRTPLSFTVSRSGKWVTNFKIKYAPFIFCQGGGVTMKSRSARVLGDGTFKAELPLYLIGRVPEGQMTVTGKFAAGGKEAGTITVGMKVVMPGCNGSSSYWTRAS